MVEPQPAVGTVQQTRQLYFGFNAKFKLVSMHEFPYSKSLKENELFLVGLQGQAPSSGWGSSFQNLLSHLGQLSP